MGPPAQPTQREKASSQQTSRSKRLVLFSTLLSIILPGRHAKEFQQTTASCRSIRSRCTTSTSPDPRGCVSGLPMELLVCTVATPSPVPVALKLTMPSLGLRGAWARLQCQGVLQDTFAKCSSRAQEDIPVWQSKASLPPPRRPGSSLIISRRRCWSSTER